jgi:hypothetical protein
MIAAAIDFIIKSNDSFIEKDIFAAQVDKNILGVYPID